MANWKLHKYYRSYVLTVITDRLNYLVEPAVLLNKDDVHGILKQITKTKSTKELDNKEYLLFLEEVYCIAAHLDLIIKEPIKK